VSLTVLLDANGPIEFEKSIEYMKTQLLSIIRRSYNSAIDCPAFEQVPNVAFAADTKKVSTKRGDNSMNAANSVYNFDLH
jgi:hypothetical protein